MATMEENPYQAPTSPPVARGNSLERLNIACGLCILVGLLLAVARSIWLSDWVLCTSIAIVVVGLLGGAVVARRRNLLKS
jgi:hypothetical protein